MDDDSFSLYDLRVTVETVGADCTCAMTTGDSFTVQGCKLVTEGANGFCFYAMQAAMPLIPAKQRQNHPADWMESDSRLTCPGTTCGLTMRIDRLGLTEFRHDDVSEVKWDSVAATPQ